MGTSTTPRRRIDFASLRPENNTGEVRADAADLNAFFSRQLEFIERETYDVQYPELFSRKFIPTGTFGVPTGAKTYTYRSYDKVGTAKLLASYAEDLPRADVSAKEDSIKIEGYGESFGYSLQDIRAAAMVNVPLESMKAEAARLGIETVLDSVYATGDVQAGSKGLLNLLNTLSYVIPNGAAGTATWVTKTPLEILADLNGIANYSWSQTYQIETPDTMLLPQDQYTLISTTPMFAVGGSDVTILDYFLKNSKFVKTVEPWYRCKGAGAAGVDRIVCYKKDPRKLKGIEPQPFEIRPPQERGLEYVSPCHARTAGVVCYYPMSVTYADGA
jgi:hypothetical protein